MNARIGEPLFFGDRNAPLFGCLHAAAEQPARHAVVILPAAGHEYQSAHRSVRQLALRLAERGCSALRFDFHGCGDSAGVKDCGNLERWQADARCAIDTLRTHAPGAAIHLVGLRLGASIAAAVGARCDLLDSVVLWDPVVKGSAYLSAGSALQRSRYGDPRADVDAPLEILGYSISAELAGELAALDLCGLPNRPAPRVFGIATTGAFPNDFTTRLKDLDCTVETRAIEAPDLWSGDGQVALVQTAVCQAIVDWISAR